MLVAERQFFDENRAAWLGTHAGQFVLVKGRDLIGTFNTYDEALAEGARRFGLESFLVRQVVDADQEVRAPALMLGILRANPACAVPGSGHKC